jgi:hypothetical protein
MTLRQHWSRTLLAFSGLAAMGTVWTFIFVFMMIYIFTIFDLWDITRLRPPEGSLARGIDGFLAGPGLMVLPLAVLAINFRLFVRAARARADTVTLPWKFGIVGFVFIGVSYFLTLDVGNYLTGVVWPHALGQSDPFLHRAVFPVLLFIIAFLLYVKVLLRFVRHGRLSHDNLTLDRGAPLV